MTDFEMITLVIAVIGIPITTLKLFLALIAFLDKRYSRKR